MEREDTARKRYATYDGGGGEEWVKADAHQVLADLTALWGDPYRKDCS
jgi:hypothetical protein